MKINMRTLKDNKENGILCFGLSHPMSIQKSIVQKYLSSDLS